MGGLCTNCGSADEQKEELLSWMGHETMNEVSTIALAVVALQTNTARAVDASKSSKLDASLKRKIMSALVMKVLHARAAAEHNKLKEEKTDRGAKGAEN